MWGEIPRESEWFGPLSMVDEGNKAVSIRSDEKLLTGPRSLHKLAPPGGEHDDARVRWSRQEGQRSGWILSM